jgi:hypothetical protein
MELHGRKSIQYKTIIDNLKIAIRETLALIDQDTLSAVTAKFEKRIELCIQQRGGHFEHLL